MTLKVLVYDDDHNNAQGIVERLKEIAGLDVAVLRDSKGALDDLEQRRRGARTGDGSGTPEGGNEFDGVDVLVVDYDLTLDLDASAGPAETGERVAYLVRAYSACRTIVALNQFADRPTFDLTLLGHPASYADLNIDGSQIDNPGLWGEPHDGFLPWAWPNLSRVPGDHDQRCVAAAGGMDEPVLEVLGLADPQVANALTRRQLAWLGTGDKSPSEATVRDCAAGGRLGLKPSDKPWNERTLASVAAARLHKWIERVVVSGQDVLVDEPHLASRYRSTADWTKADRGLPEIDTSVLGDHRHAAPLWTARPVYLWPSVSQDTRIREVDDPFAPVDQGLYFAEDSSVFRHPAETRPFTADVEPFSRRYITRQGREDERAHPPYAGPHGLSAVSYQPAVNLAR